MAARPGGLRNAGRVRPGGLRNGATVRKPADDKPDDGGFSLGGLLGNAADEAKAIVTGLPKAGVKLGKDFAEGYATGGGFDAGVKKALIDPQVEYVKEKYGPLAPGGAPASDTAKAIYEQPISTALDALGVTSLAAGGVTRTARAAAAPGGARARYRASKQAPQERKLTYGQAEVTPLASDAPVTRLAQRMLDRASMHLGERGGPLSARSRVAKRTAKELRQDIRRGKAAGTDAANQIVRLGGPASRLPRFETFERIRSRPERTAFFWEAQLPEAARGGPGLRAIAADLRRQGDAATDPQVKRRLLRQAAMAEAAAKSKRTYDPAALDAARRLMSERERIFQAAGKLDPETATAREGLLARRLGVEGEGAVYVGHRTKAQPKARERAGQVRHAGGETQTPAGIGKRNELKAYQTGRLRVDPDVIVEDWQRALHYDFLNQSKDLLAKMGEPIGPDGPNKGWFVVNRNGHKLPRRWKDTDPAEAAEKAGFDPDDILLRDVDEYVNNFIANEERAGNLLAKSAPEDVVQVHPKVVSQFFNTLVGPQGAGGKLRATGEAVDAVNDFVRGAVLYANAPAYVLTNLAGNTALAVAHQGPFYLPGNLWRASKALRAGDREFRNRLLAEVGMGPSAALASQGKNPVSRTVRKVAEVEGRVADDLLRAAAWMHEARKAGYRSRAEQARLLRDPELRPTLNHLRQRVNDAMVDFELQGPVEKALLGRTLFVWTWIRGATKYPFRYAADHPARTALASHAALQAAEDPSLQVEGDDSLIPVGERRGRLQDVVSPNAANVASTPLGMVGGLASGERSVYDALHPGLRIGIDAVTGRNRFGADVGTREAVKQDVEYLSPLYRMLVELADPSKSSRRYGPQDREQVLRRRLFRGLVPYQVDRNEVRR